MQRVEKSVESLRFNSRSLLRKEPFPDLLESVIPESFYRESRRGRNWIPDSIKTFGGDALG